MEKEKLYSLTFLKIIALLSIFWWHSFLPKPEIDLGARACTFFFVCSGFLVAYNYSDKNIECSWKSSLELFLKKFILFWPLHFIITSFHLLINGFSSDKILRYL